MFKKIRRHFWIIFIAILLILITYLIFSGRVQAERKDELKEIYRATICGTSCTIIRDIKYNKDYIVIITGVGVTITPRLEK